MEYINLLIDRGLGNFMDERTDEALLNDERYIRRMEQAETIKEQFYETELSEAQEELLYQKISIAIYTIRIFMLIYCLKISLEVSLLILK